MNPDQTAPDQDRRSLPFLPNCLAHPQTAITVIVIDLKCEMFKEFYCNEEQFCVYLQV